MSLLKKLGLKIRRFPLWLHIFNVLAGLTLLSITSAGIISLFWVSDDRSSYFSTDSLDHARILEALGAGEAKALGEALSKLAAGQRYECSRELAALCEPGAVLAILHALEMSPAPQVAAVAEASVRALELDAAPKLRELEDAIAQFQDDDLLRLRLIRQGLKGSESALETRLAREALLRVDDRRAAALLLDQAQRSESAKIRSRLTTLMRLPPNASDEEIGRAVANVAGVVRP